MTDHAPFGEFFCNSVFKFAKIKQCTKYQMSIFVIHHSGVQPIEKAKMRIEHALFRFHVTCRSRVRNNHIIGLSQRIQDASFLILIFHKVV